MRVARAWPPRASPCAIEERPTYAAAPLDRQSTSTRRRLVDRQRLPDRLLRHLDLHAGALLLQEHRHARVALGPAAIERLGHLLERDVGEPHRHLVLAAERRRQSDVLVGQPQRERRWVELPRQELIGEPVERAPPAAGALADRLPQRDRLGTRLAAPP